MKKLFVAIGVIIFVIVACDFLGERMPAPDIEILKLSPLAFYICDSTTTVIFDSVTIVPRNSVDGIVNAFFWEFYTPDSVMIGSRSEPYRIHFFIRGLTDTASAETSFVVNLALPAQTALDHIQNSTDNSVWGKLFLVAEDAYGHDKEDTTFARFTLYYLSGGAILSVSANPDNIDVGDTSLVTATLTTLTGSPIVGDTVYFQTDMCHISDGWKVTDANGQGEVTFYGDSVCVATVTANHSQAASKGAIITVNDTTKY